MIRLSRREHTLIKHAQADCADLSRDKLARVADCHLVSVGRILTALTRRELITIERGANRRILSITPTFEMKRNETFYVGNPSRKPLF